MPLLEAPDDDQPVRPWTAVFAAVAAYHDPAAAVGTDEYYEFRIDGESLTLSSLSGRRRSSDHSAVVFESAAPVWVDIRQGRLTLAEAVATGRLTVTGPKKSVANFRRIFDID
jgi:hypothetical protein